MASLKSRFGNVKASGTVTISPAKAASIGSSKLAYGQVTPSCHSPIEQATPPESGPPTTFTFESKSNLGLPEASRGGFGGFGSGVRCGAPTGGSGNGSVTPSIRPPLPSQSQLFEASDYQSSSTIRGGGFGGGGDRPAIAGDFKWEEEIDENNGEVAVIIGKGGANIRRMMNESGAHIQVVKGNAREGKKMLMMRAVDSESLELAKQIALDSVARLRTTSNVNGFTPTGGMLPPRFQQPPPPPSTVFPRLQSNIDGVAMGDRNGPTRPFDHAHAKNVLEQRPSTPSLTAVSSHSPQSTIDDPHEMKQILIPAEKIGIFTKEKLASLRIELNVKAILSGFVLHINGPSSKLEEAKGVIEAIFREKGSSQQAPIGASAQMQQASIVAAQSSTYPVAPPAGARSRMMAQTGRRVYTRWASSSSNDSDQPTVNLRLDKASFTESEDEMHDAPIDQQARLTNSSSDNGGIVVCSETQRVEPASTCKMTEIDGPLTTTNKNTGVEVLVEECEMGGAKTLPFVGDAVDEQIEAGSENENMEMDFNDLKAQITKFLLENEAGKKTVHSKPALPETPRTVPMCEKCGVRQRSVLYNCSHFLHCFACAHPSYHCNLCQKEAGCAQVLFN